MRVLTVRNVQEALPEGIRLLLTEGILRDTRFGPVRVHPHPVTTHYLHPEECVLFWPQRDANPFFHFFEALWMLLGRQDVESLEYYSSNVSQFSDDGEIFHGAYGHRWMHHFEFNQLKVIRDLLADNPKERRAVLQMWDARIDLGRNGKDLPCNTQVYFWIEDADSGMYLNMTVCNRSNDIIWGAYGANAVHFSFLQQFMAHWIGVKVGSYWQMSNNFHGYLKTLEPLQELQTFTADPPYTGTDHLQPYGEGGLTTFPLLSETDEVDKWLQELLFFWQEGPTIGFKAPFLRKVATPIKKAFDIYKTQGPPTRYLHAMRELAECRAEDWRMACLEWLNRRYQKWVIKNKAESKED